MVSCKCSLELRVFFKIFKQHQRSHLPCPGSRSMSWRRCRCRGGGQLGKPFARHWDWRSPWSTTISSMALGNGARTIWPSSRAPLCKTAQGKTEKRVETGATYTRHKFCSCCFFLFCGGGVMDWTLYWVYRLFFWLYIVLQLSLTHSPRWSFCMCFGVGNCFGLWADFGPPFRHQSQVCQATVRWLT